MLILYRLQRLSCHARPWQPLEVAECASLHERTAAQVASPPGLGTPKTSRDGCYATGYCSETGKRNCDCDITWRRQEPFFTEDVPLYHELVVPVSFLFSRIGHKLSRTPWNSRRCQRRRLNCHDSRVTTRVTIHESRLTTTRVTSHESHESRVTVTTSNLNPDLNPSPHCNPTFTGKAIALSATFRVLYCAGASLKSGTNTTFPLLSHLQALRYVRKLSVHAPSFLKKASTGWRIR
jgi:hypothetical protein